MKKYRLVYMMISLLIVSSCRKNPEIGGTTAEKMANEWWVKLTVNGTDVFGIGHHHLVTYNTSANDNNLWVDDQKNGYGFKSKVTASFDSLSFATAGSSNLYYNSSNPAAFPQSVKITEGKILENQGVSRTGNTTDSIYMKIIFSDDPSTTYVISGHARTRFAEDDY